MENQINELIEAIVADYAIFCRDFNDPEGNVQRMRDSLSVKAGRRYIKVIREGSVWGFIVPDDQDKKFRKGDILKAAGWSTPARNSARGNILDGGYSVSWTGPNYLR
jgi:hypothetical protein